MKNWTTACPDWEERIVAGDSLIPLAPLFPDQAEAGLRVFKELRVVDLPGSPTYGEVCRPWVFDFVAAIFGAYDHETGRRLIREFFWLVSKKNTKSTIGAGVMLTATIINWRMLNEFLFLAPTIEIANNAFFPARDAIRADEELSDLLHIQEHSRLITHLETRATLKVVAADSETVAGKKAAATWIDELWLFGKRANAQNMLREATGGLMARPEGFVVYSSTQSDAPPAGVFKQKLSRFRKIRDGEIEDRKSLPVIYEFPKAYLPDPKRPEHRNDAKCLDPSNFYVTNPNLGASVDAEWIVDKYQEAKLDDETEPGTLQGFLAKHLNIEITQGLVADGWAGADIWPRGAEDRLDLDAVIDRSDALVVGIDGGGLDDLLSISVIGREIGTRHWLHWAHALIGPEGMRRRKKNETVYRQFMAEGDLTLVAGLPDDLDWIVSTVERLKDTGSLCQVGADPSGIGGLVDALAEIGVTEESKLLTGVAQGIRLMGAIKTVERKLADGTFRHGGSSLMSWCVGNAKVRLTSTAMMVERTAAGWGKIDPLMATFDAAHLMGLNPGPAGGLMTIPDGYEIAVA